VNASHAACLVKGLFGPCAAGTYQSVDRWVTSLQTVQAKPEDCNGVDDDCNNVIDDGLHRAEVCEAQGVQGECAHAGTWSCTSGAWTCSAALPSSETCDNKDNDCDGVVDNVPRGAACGGTGECKKFNMCDGGVIKCMQVVGPVAEVCGDGKDNDCNGVVDNGCCTPTTEVCDGKDNDCDGQIDEGGVCGTATCPSGTRKCGTGAKCCGSVVNGCCDDRCVTPPQVCP